MTPENEARVTGGWGPSPSQQPLGESPVLGLWEEPGDFGEQPPRAEGGLVDRMPAFQKPCIQDLMTF